MFLPRIDLRSGGENKQVENGGTVGGEESGERPRLRLLTRRLSVRVLFAEPNAFHRTLPSFWFTDHSAISLENGQYSTDLALSGRMQLTGRAAELAALWESTDQFLTFSKLAGLLVNSRARAQICWTVAGLTPCSRAISRTLQCVAFFGVVCMVFSTSSAS